MTDLLLYRPVGEEELRLVEATGWKRFPPRLPGQPIFYPVLERRYAATIAREWNAKGSGAGFVTEFRVERPWIDQFPVQVVGARTHSELWVPSERLEEFNDRIRGSIAVVEAFYGPDYAGERRW